MESEKMDNMMGQIARTNQRLAMLRKEFSDAIMEIDAAIITYAQFRQGEQQAEQQAKQTAEKKTPEAPKEIKKASESSKKGTN